MRLISLMCALMWMVPVAAEEVYKTTDAAGNVIYSDKPSPEAEVIQIQEAQTVPADNAPPFDYKAPAPSTAYTKLAIDSPENDAAFRPEDDSEGIQVTAHVEPQIRGQDSYVLFLDAKEFGTSKSPSFLLKGLERGSHQVAFKIRDPDGKDMISSDLVTFHILKVSVPPKKAAPPPPPPKPPTPPKAP
jgi:hypothetical protein